MTIDQGFIKRRYERIDTRLPARVATTFARYNGSILNVSSGGCLIEGPIRARVGQIFAVGFPKLATWEIFRCKIMWAAPKGETVQYGNTFLTVDETAKRLLMLSLIEAAGIDLP
jgi:hypothetical protein